MQREPEGERQPSVTAGQSTSGVNPPPLRDAASPGINGAVAGRAENSSGPLAEEKRSLRDELEFLLDSTVDLPAYDKVAGYDRETLLMRLESAFKFRLEASKHEARE